MSIKRLIKEFNISDLMTLAIILGLTIGYGLSSYQNKTIERQIASHSSSASWTPSSKTHGIFAVSIEPVGAIPNSETDELQLKGKIKLLKESNGDVVYKWVIPQSLNLISGELEDVLSGMKIGETAEVTIYVDGMKSMGNMENVILTASIDEDGINVGNSSISNKEELMQTQNKDTLTTKSMTKKALSKHRIYQ